MSDSATPLKPPVHPPHPTTGWVPPAPPRVRPIRALATAVRWLIVAATATAVLTIAVELYGIAAIDAFLSGSADLAALEAYDAVYLGVAILSLLVLIPAGVCWVVWQYRAAAALPAGSVRRSPAWHAGSWFIPIVSWWFPLQNVSDLAGASRAALRPPILGVWWTLWLASSVIGTVGAMIMPSSTLQEISAASVVGIVSEAAIVAAAPLAWLIVTRITDAIQPPAR